MPRKITSNKVKQKPWNKISGRTVMRKTNIYWFKNSLEKPLDSQRIFLIAYKPAKGCVHNFKGERCYLTLYARWTGCKWRPLSNRYKEIKTERVVYWAYFPKLPIL